MSELIDREAALDAIKFAEFGCEYEEVEKVPIFNPWRKVEEELPKDGEWVLIWGDGFHVQIQAFHESGSWIDDQFEKYTATHWMPLPEPPQEDA